jgi:hypothetical protein
MTYVRTKLCSGSFSGMACKVVLPMVLSCQILGGCGRSKQVAIFGCHSEIASRGVLNELDLRNSGKVGVAVISPRQMDVAMSSNGNSGNHSDNVHCWKDQRTLRLRNPDQALPIVWIYCTDTQQLQVNGVSFHLPIGSMGVITLDSDRKPLLELREYTAEHADLVRISIGAINTEEAIPAQPLP